MTGSEILSRLSDAGINYRMDGAEIVLTPADLVTEEIRNTILSERGSVVAAIRSSVRKPRAESKKRVVLGYRCTCGSISYLPRTFRWRDVHGGKHWGFTCLKCTTRYWMV